MHIQIYTHCDQLELSREYIYSIMGQENGKNELAHSHNYIQEQLQLFRWRADANSNAHIARVNFASKHTVVNKERLQMLLTQQLQKNAYVDVGQMMQLSTQIAPSMKDQVMTFENYVGDLTILEGKLALEENLYALEVLLRGYETVLQKMGKVFIGTECCFLTEEGEVRAWINTNYMSNDCQMPARRESKLEGAFQTSEVGAVKEIIRLSEQLAGNPTAYLHFLRQLRSFLDRDILHNLNFASVRRFINGYLYTYRLTLPSNLQILLNKLKLTQTRQRSINSFHQNMNSSLAQLIEDREYASKAKLASTGANLETFTRRKHDQPDQPSQNNKSHSVSGISECSSRHQFEYYRPSSKKLHEKKLSTAELPRQKDKNLLQKHLSRSQMVSKKDIDRKQHSPLMSNSFSRKEYNYYQENISIPQQTNFSFTPNKNNLCDSTALCSQFTHSKEQSRLTNSKVDQSYSTLQFTQARASKGRLEKKANHCKYVNFCNEEKRQGDKENWNQELFQKKWNHSKQPSFDENSSAVFVNPSPTCHTPKPAQSRDTFPSRHLQLRQSQIVIQEGQSGRVSTIGQKSQSQHLSRQVSGLVSNQNLSLHESQGSFISMGSCGSDYKGMLMKMGRSAKLVNIPSSKKVESQFKGTTYPNLKA